ncbi:MAG: ATP-grasp domain-containing protein [Gammaproteobacteria bacterium]|nr:ATP-grasp domain-containing protein [Gammaproteobacteria bacterium]
MTTALLTLGRLPKALDIARALQGAGVRVIVAEPFRRHLSGASRAVDQSFVVTAPAVDGPRYLKDLCDLVIAQKVDLVVPISEEIVHASALHGRLPPGCRLMSMPQTAVLEAHHKGRFVETCRTAGIRAPETADATTPEATAIAARHDYVVKPVSSCSGRGVRFLSRGDPLPRIDEPSIIQRRVQGRLVSSFSIARAGEVRCTVLYRGAVMQGTVAVCFERIEVPAEIDDWIRRFVAAVRWDGFISFDLIVDDDGHVHGIECNPRATSGIHFVEPAGLAEALLNPAGSHPPTLRPERLSQQFFPCLTETQKSMFSPRFRYNLRCLLEAREVTWKISDPWPFLGMPYTAWNIIALASRTGMTFGEVAMLDFAIFAGGEREVVE